MAHLFGKEMSKKEILKRVGHFAQLASVKPFTFGEGKANGLKAFEVTTGSGFDFTVLEGKCLDISSVKYKGINLNFLSKPGLVSPEYFNPHGNEFLRNFQAGMLYTCGLLNVGPTNVDDGVEYCMHGRIGCTPAEKVSVTSQWRDDEYIMEISGEVREAALFNENLVLKRTISAQLGAKSFKIYDEVENQGFEEQALMILYHFNFGYPLLDETAEFVAPGFEVVPRTEEAKKGIETYGEFSAPIDHYKEQVFYHRLACDEEGNTYAALINKELELGAYIKYNIKQLPELIQWKSMASGDYALGIEPANCRLGGRVKERERGALKKIQPLEKAVFELELGVLEGLDEIAQMEKKIRSLTSK